MAFSKAAALRSCLRSARPTIARPQLFRQIARRAYASGGHGSAKAGSDAPWAAGAVGVTVPACWYLLSNAPDTSHGHDDHGDAHGESHGEEHEEAPKDEGEGEKSDDTEEKGDGSEDEKDTDTPDTSEDEGEGDGKGKPLGEAADPRGDDPKDKAATSKPAGSQNTQSGKQEGLSNTDTKHSTDITSNPEKSKKGEGVPETGKAKGTVDPKRPQV